MFWFLLVAIKRHGMSEVDFITLLMLAAFADWSKKSCLDLSLLGSRSPFSKVAFFINTSRGLVTSLMGHRGYVNLHLLNICHAKYHSEKYFSNLSSNLTGNQPHA